MAAPAVIPTPANLKPYEIFRYGIIFDGRKFNDFEIELYCYKIGRPRRLGGLGKFGHFKKFVDMTWNDPAISPNVNFVWNDWSEQMIKSAIRNKMSAWAGCASSGKSACAAMFAIVEYLSDPMHTLVIVTSTTLTGARQRIWKSLDQYWRALPGLPGIMVPSIGRLKGANLDGKTFGEGTGIFLLASEKKKEKDALGKLIGIKAVDDLQNGQVVRPGRLILIADELPELPESLVHAAFTNLWANPGFKMVALGNPNSYFDAFGLVCKPKDGWDSVSEDDQEWETDRGVCLRFDASLSPLIQGDSRCHWMYSQERIDEMARDYGERSVYYYRMVKGFWAPQGSVDSLYAPSDILKFGTGSVVWGLRSPIRVAALDPAFSYGGDRSILYFGTYGESAEGLATLQFDGCVALKEDLELVRKGTPRSQQIIQMFREECEKRGVRPENVAFDSTGAGPFGDMISAMWSNQVMRVNFAGKATSRPISPHDRTPASERYDNKMSELWAVGKSLLRAGQLKGIDNDLAKEMCQRTYDTVKGGEGMRIRVESKPDYRARIGESPDCFVAGTLVATPSGEVPIETLSEGDIVLTPFGESRILKCHVNDATDLVSVRLAGGRELTGKPRHKVLVRGVGWVCMDDLSLTDEIESVSYRRIWTHLIRLFTRAKPLEFKHLVDTISATTKKGFAASDCFTELSGLTRWARFRKVTWSTMLMMTGTTTALKICGRCFSAITRACTFCSALNAPSIGVETRTTWVKPRRQPRFGTHPRRDLSGTANTASAFLGTDHCGTSCVAIAGARLLPGITPSFAPSPAGRVIEEPVTSTINRVCAKFADLATLAIGIVRPGRAVTSVERISLPESVKVYNLTLAEENAYYANGVLVQNCADAAFVMIDLCRERFAFKSGERAASSAPLVGPAAGNPAAYRPPPTPWHQFVNRVSLDIPSLI